MVLVASGFSSADNSLGDAPLNWQLPITTTIDIPQGSWFLTGQLQLQLQIEFDITTNTGNAKPNSERFLNPTQSQLGHWALESGGFVESDGRLKYNLQRLTVNSPQIQIGNTRQSAPIRLGNTDRTKASHAQGISDVVICGNVSGAQVPPGAPFVGNISLTSPGPSSCLTIFPGQLELEQIDTFPSATATLQISTNEFAFPDLVKGVIWVGQALAVNYRIVTIEDRAIATQLQQGNFILGDAVPAVYGYGCAFGQVIPSLTNPPCPVPVLTSVPVPGGGVTNIAGCPVNQVP